jgi:hypothetical protein
VRRFNAAFFLFAEAAWPRKESGDESPHSKLLPTFAAFLAPQRKRR